MYNTIVMKRNRKYIYLGLINFILLAAGIRFLFFSDNLSATEVEKSKKIGACYNNLQNSFFNVLNNEIKSVVEEKGDRLIIRDSLLSQEKQNEQIHELLEEGVVALIIAPVDWKDIRPALEEARARNVAVIIIDSQIYDETMADCTITSDNYDVGVQLANYLKSQRTEADILLLEQNGSGASKERVKGFADGLDLQKGKNDYQIVKTQQCNGSFQDARNKVSLLLEQGEEFNCVFAVNDPCAMGAIVACEDYGIRENVDFLSTDGSPEGKKLIRNSIMMVTAAQFPAEMGNRTVDSLYKILNHEPYESNIKVPVKLITRYTVNSYDLEKWN